MNIALIPARGGSKRIPQKNIKYFNGFPIIYYAINNAINSKLFDHIFVSTDDEEIKIISEKFGAKCIAIRPEILSNDLTSTLLVIQYEINNMEKFNIFPEFICCIYPCSPLINKNDLIDSYKLQIKNPNKFVLPIIKFRSKIQRALKLNNENELSNFFNKYEFTRSQDLEECYHDAGQFYWGHKSTWLNSDSVFNNSIGYELPINKLIDIDTIDDWEFAEKIYKNQI